jgi:predicted nucleic acid-binding protein
MSSEKRTFVDSDVIISSIISNKGAAFLLLDQQIVDYYISNKSHAEIKKVVRRMNLDKKALNKLVQEKLKTTKLKENIDKIKKKYIEFVLDENDAHIVAGAVWAKADFLITYNQKHYKIEKIKRDLGIIIYTPAQLLQYLRSVN